MKLVLLDSSSHSLFEFLEVGLSRASRSPALELAGEARAREGIEGDALLAAVEETVGSGAKIVDGEIVF